jgi:hypothetical protein
MASTVFPIATAATGVYPTWTQLGFTNPSGLTSLTFSSLGGYKYIKVVGIQFSTTNSATNLRLRINADSTAAMYINGGVQYSGTNGTVAIRSAGPTTGFDLGSYDTSAQNNYIELEFINPTQTDGKKIVNYNFPANDGATVRHNIGSGIYNSNSAITSIVFSSTNSYAFDVGNGATTGFYVYGAN